MGVMRGNQLPVFAARWQHGSQICFSNFILQNITKLLKTQQQLKLEKKVSTDLESLEFYKNFGKRLT
jgi:hypothetical protein